MSWLNVFGLGFLAIILIPNLIFALTCPQGFENSWQNRRVEIIEQIGRFGCMAFMAVNIPGTWFGWWSDEAFAVYLIADTLLAAAYCLVWLFCFRKNTLFRALALSILPAALFLLSGILSRSIPLTLSALLFAPSHILISYKNAAEKV